jgi:hypothetical protein
MNIFDEDHNGQAVFEDVVRVLRTYEDMNDQKIAEFAKICMHGEGMDDETRAAKFEDLKLPQSFDIKKAIQYFYNV